jgi:hypothetical protein
MASTIPVSRSSRVRATAANSRMRESSEFIFGVRLEIGIEKV